MLFFQHRMMLAHKDGRYADLGEKALYNTISGPLPRRHNFEYTNPLTRRPRVTLGTHVVLRRKRPRNLLELPTWTYAKSESSLYINLFVGGRRTWAASPAPTFRSSRHQLSVER